MFRNLQILCFVFLLSVSLVFAAAPGGTAEGTFVLDGKTYQMKYSYARHEKSMFDENKMDTTVVITDAPLEKAPEGLGDLMTPMSQDKVHGFLITMDDQNQIYYVVIGEAQMSGSVKVKFEPATAKDGVAGHITSNGEQDAMGRKYKIDTKFSAPVK